MGSIAALVFWIARKRFSSLPFEPASFFSISRDSRWLIGGSGSFLLGIQRPEHPLDRQILPLAQAAPG